MEQKNIFLLLPIYADVSSSTENLLSVAPIPTGRSLIEKFSSTKAIIECTGF
jgi:hypothetical protein